MHLSAGQQLGPYVIEAPAGSGGMGEVYRATDTRLNRTVAIKIMPSHASLQEGMRARFEREAKTLSSLNHPNICTLHDIGQTDGIDYLVLEFLEGETLEARLRRGKMGLAEALTIGQQIGEALASAHRRGLIHRDLKPSNVYLTESGAKLLDFGLAKFAAETVTGMHDDTASTPVTSRGQIVGTLQYMSPEQLEGREADERSDIFAMGACLYEMMTGARPFTGTSKASLIGSIMKEIPEPITAATPTSPPSLDRLIHKCLDKEPDKRWQTARDLTDELSWIATSANNSDEGPKSRGVSVIAGVGMLSLMVVAIAFAVFFFRAKQSAAETRKSLAQIQESHDFLTSVYTEVIPWGCGDTISVLEMLNQTTERLDGSFPDNPEGEADLRLAIGHAYKSIGAAELGRREHEAAVRLRTKSLGELADETIAAREELSYAYQMLGATNDLIENEKAILDAIQKRSDGSNELEIADAKSSVAAAISTRRRIDDAHSYALDAFETYQRVLGADSAETIVKQLNLAWVLLDIGRIDEAAPLIRNAYDRSLDTHGEHSFTSRRSRSMMAMLYITKGDLDSAKALYGYRAIPEDIGFVYTFQGDDDFDRLPAQLFIWFETWCPWSHIALKRLRNIYPNYNSEGLEIVAVTRITGTASMDAVPKYLAENRFPFPTYKDNGRASNFFECGGLPSMRLVHDGYLIWEYQYIGIHKVQSRMLEGLVAAGQTADSLSTRPSSG